ncbi:hypothetical protein ERJ77_17620 [Vibrio anguillarum]|uniref:Uncharacterized protein n=1 Tax=Vibrio anguillarum TaxID=55601 RepID=A0AAW4BMT6_VIBAN|nr:hypothetical protein [Vibrio anguillarum]
MAALLKTPNAALSSEQRIPPNLNHCAVNTKFKANRKCRALGICLKRFVIFFLTYQFQKIVKRKTLEIVASNSN